MPLWAIGIVHVTLLACGLSPADALWSRPLGNWDYPPHFYNALHMAERLRHLDQPWGYDPGWMAGYPQSPGSLIDNKLFGLVVFLAPPGWEAAAFNATVLLGLACVPWVLHGAARAAGSSKLEAGGAALAGTALTFGAPLTVHFWATGLISFVFASVLVVPAALGLTAALAAERLLSTRGLAASGLAALAIFIHTLSAIPLGFALLPALSMTLRRARWRSLAALLALAALLGLTLLPAVVGLAANLEQLRPLPPRGFTWLPGGFNAFVFDWWVYLLPNLAGGGAGSLAAVVLLAVIGIVQPGTGGRSAPRRAVIAAIAGCALLAYFGPSLWGSLQRLQPHRFSITLGYFAAIPAGWGFGRLVASFRKRDWGAPVFALLLLVLIVVPTWALRHLRSLGSGVDLAETEIASFLAESVRDDGRVLIETGKLRAPPASGSSGRINMVRFSVLPLKHDREFLGSDHVELTVAQRYTTFYGGQLFGRPLAKIDAGELRELLARYAVSAVVACAAETRATLDRFGEILEPVKNLADCRGYRVRDAATSRLLEGRAEVRAGLDRIEVRGAEGERLVLKYHWMPALRTEPPLPIEEAPQPGTPVGFISIRPRGTRDFDIVVDRCVGIGDLLRGRVRRVLGAAGFCG